MLAIPDAWRCHRSSVRIAVVTAVVIAAARSAAATPSIASLGDAIAKPDDAAVASLRAQLPGDAAVRCTLGTVYSKRGDLPRADLYLAGCDTTMLPDAISEAVIRAVHATARALHDSELAGIDIDVQPDGATVDAEVDSLPGERFTAPRVVWVPAGHRVVRVFADGQTVDQTRDVKPRSHAPVVVSLAASAAPPATHTQVANFENDEPAAQVEGPPPDVKHPPMRISILEQHDAPGGEAIPDPLVTTSAHSPWTASFRAGGGVFDETGGPSRLGPSIAAVASLELLRAKPDGRDNHRGAEMSRLSLDLRLDWTRRGSDAIDTNGLTLGPTVTALRLPQLASRAGAGARADLRLESSDTFFAPMGMQSPQLAAVTNAANVSAAAWLDVPLRRWPVTIGARFERSLTALGFNVHDEAVIVEAGFELR